jgi:iron complex transport system ATP-binding protein
MLELNNVSYSINNRKILNEVSFGAKTNRVLAILGPNGAGKSTLMNIFSGILKPQQGSVFFNNQNISRIEINRLSRLRSVVTQKSNLNTPYNVFDVVMMGRTPHILSTEKENLEIVTKALEDTSLLSFIDRDYTKLSGGEQQRVHIARALAQIAYEKVNENRYLMLDEHTSNLDIGKAYNLMNICKSFVNYNLGVIWIVHDINLALDFADDFLFLKSGNVISKSTKDKITEELISELYDIKIIKKHLESDRICFLPANQN